MNETTTPSLTGRGRAARRALTVAGAAAAALALWALAGPAAGIDLTVGSGGTARTVGAGAVITSALVAGLAAWALLASMERFLRAPARVWTTIAAVVLVLSLAGPFTAGAGTAGTLVLGGLHLLVGAVLIPGLALTARGA
ncbi:hypothetical protein GCM10023085_10640 [Actinomadura viridis]|uniref:Uncharacterized protein n=1 Tax=Actinomadura viridis TaxID=58110 RepID=A0A931GLZ3_9ACTN|nr:DUF6069 family protein [Actinomadura viridis]MBG6092072.1 hypothetical protein [Actinomadura viridis]